MDRGQLEILARRIGQEVPTVRDPDFYHFADPRDRGNWVAVPSEDLARAIAYVTDRLLARDDRELSDLHGRADLLEWAMDDIPDLVRLLATSVDLDVAVLWLSVVDDIAALVGDGDSD
jgi:hypothetical protein